MHGDPTTWWGYPSTWRRGRRHWSRWLPRGGGLMVEMVGLRKEPQEYHSAPISNGRYGTSAFWSLSLPLATGTKNGQQGRKPTASPGSAVVEALGRAERVGHVAGGKDAGFADGSGLAIMITTVIDTGNGRHDDWWFLVPAWLFVDILGGGWAERSNDTWNLLSGTKRFEANTKRFGWWEKGENLLCEIMGDQIRPGYFTVTEKRRQLW